MRCISGHLKSIRRGAWQEPIFIFALPQTGRPRPPTAPNSAALRLDCDFSRPSPTEFYSATKIHHVPSSLPPFLGYDSAGLICIATTLGERAASHLYSDLPSLHQHPSFLIGLIIEAF